MTDLSTQQPSLSLPTAPARVLRFPVQLLKYLLRSRRTIQIDTCNASAHLLKDIGISRSRNVPPLPSHSRLW